MNLGNLMIDNLAAQYHKVSGKSPTRLICSFHTLVYLFQNIHSLTVKHEGKGNHAVLTPYGELVVTLDDRLAQGKVYVDSGEIEVGDELSGV